MPVLNLAIKSLLNRRYSVLLTVLSIALSIALLLGVERLRVESRASFANTISGTDLIVGARSGAINLLLYSVFRIGDATNNISWSSYQQFATHPQVAWTIPLSLGDSHRGYAVLGTSTDYFRHYQYRRDQSLSFSAGQPFSDVYDAVLGSEVAQKLGYALHDQIVVAHGAGKTSFTLHDDKPFTVVGILAPTGTPVDRTVHISLAGMEAIHVNWRGGVQIPGLVISAEQALERDLTPKAITAFLVGLNSRIATFRVAREINDYRAEPLLAILPGVALQQLWDMMRIAENALLLVSALVVVVGLLGMLTVMLAGLNERRREMAILRSVGARPFHILFLISGETLVLGLAGILAGLLFFYTGLFFARPLVQDLYGITLGLGLPAAREWRILGIIALAGPLIGLIPGYRAYRHALNDGLTMRI